MITPVPMVRLRAVLLERDSREALQALGGLGLLHLIRTQAGPETAPLEPPRPETAWDDLQERVDRLRKNLGLGTSSQVAASGRAFREESPSRIPGQAWPKAKLERSSTAGARFDASMSDGESLSRAAGGLPPKRSSEAVESELRALERRTGKLLEQREETARRREERSERAERLQSFLGLGITLERPGPAPFLRLFLGSLPPERLETLQQSVGERILLWPLALRGGRRPLAAICGGAEGGALHETLREAEFQEEPLPHEGSLDAYVQGVAREAGQAAEEEARLEAEIRALGDEIAPHLSELERSIQMERGLLEAEGHFPRTEASLLLQGWVPADQAPLLEQRLLEATKGRCVLETTSPRREEEEQVPVLLRPAPWLRPFGKLVAGYGLPKYQELSPTPFVAISYLLMFGMMFGDAGHGALLALAGLAALHKWRDAGLLLLGGGLASILFGALYGSCFGLERFKALALWKDPLEGDPIHLMALAIGLGVLMISLGLVLNILNRIRGRDLLGALMGRFGVAGLLFYWGALAMLLRPENLPPLLPALLLLPLVAWVLREPLQEALGGASGHVAESEDAGLTGSLVEAFETLLVYLANTISFVRLAAYAMSHAALLAATLMMAQAVAHPDGRAGLLSWMVLVAGNLVAILMEGVIASVQALRLEYYEFFSKFFSGAGRPFQPFRLDVERSS